MLNNPRPGLTSFDAAVPNDKLPLIELARGPPEGCIDLQCLCQVHKVGEVRHHGDDENLPVGRGDKALDVLVLGR